MDRQKAGKVPEKGMGLCFGNSPLKRPFLACAEDEYKARLLLLPGSGGAPARLMLRAAP